MKNAWINWATQPFSITDVEARESGQSLLEFVVALPLFLAFAMMLVRVNSAVQVSIVNQRYVRSQTLYLAHNSPIFPEIRLRNSPPRTMAERGVNQVILGMSDRPISEDAQGRPRPTIMRLVGATKPIGQDDPILEGNQRGRVRVRSTVSICSQVNSVQSSTGFTDVRRAPDGAVPVCSWSLQ